MATERMTAIVGARISEFKRKMAEVNATMRKTASNVVVNVVVRYKKAQERLDKIADTIRTLQTVGGNMVFGSLFAISPALVPILAATVGAIGALGPMVGVLAGSTFALATAFGFAGAAALAFGAVAVPTIKALFDENAKLNKQQKAARAEFDKMKETWQGIVKDLEKPVLDAFTKSMKITTKVLNMAKPLFESSAKAVNNLLDSLNKSLDSAPVRAFFDYMNKQGGPMLETMGKAMGNFMQGFMSMMVAFGPLAESTSKGFLQMSKNFATWAAGLSKSEKFQSFVKYVQENMPKLRAIFRDATAGLVYMFSAFGPLASDMMTGLQNMMARFKEWAKSLSQNEKFQKFIGYIQENAPQVLTLIGNLVDLIINLGIALAPLGAKILELVNQFLAWTNKMIENHPWVGKLIGGIIVMTGIFQALYPIITVVITMFSGFGGILVKLGGLVAKIFPFIMQAFNIMKMNLIIGLKMLGQNALKFLSTIVRMGGQVIMWLGRILARAVVWAVRLAAQWLIAMGPVGWVIATVVALVILIIANWDKVKAYTIKIWNAVSKWIKDTWNKIKSAVSEGAQAAYKAVSDKFNEIVSFLKGLGSTFFNAGKGLVDQMAKGIKAAAGKVLKEMKDLAAKARDFLPFSPAKTGPLSDIGKLNFGGPIADSIARAKSLVRTSLGDLLTVPEIGFNPAVAGQVQPMKVSTPSRYESKGNKDLGATLVEAMGNLVAEMNVQVGEEQIIKAVGKPMLRYMKNQKDNASLGRR